MASIWKEWRCFTFFITSRKSSIQIVFSVSKIHGEEIGSAILFCSPVLHRFVSMVVVNIFVGVPGVTPTYGNAFVGWVKARNPTGIPPFYWDSTHRPNIQPPICINVGWAEVRSPTGLFANLLGFASSPQPTGYVLIRWNPINYRITGDSLVIETILFTCF